MGLKSTHTPLQPFFNFHLFQTLRRANRFIENGPNIDTSKCYLKMKDLSQLFDTFTGHRKFLKTMKTKKRFLSKEISNKIQKRFFIRVIRSKAFFCGG